MIQGPSRCPAYLPTGRSRVHPASVLHTSPFHPEGDPGSIPPASILYPRGKSRFHPTVLHTAPTRKILGPSWRSPYLTLVEDSGSIPMSSILHPTGRSRVHPTVLHTLPCRKIQGPSHRPPSFTLEEDLGSIPPSSIVHPRERSRAHPAVLHTSP
jgi:hypothetical protein